jgi:acyl carrier protein
MSDVREDFETVCRQIFKDQNLSINREQTAADIKGWDSLNHIRLVLALEKKFSIKFKSSEVMRLKNLGEFIDMISAKISQKPL